MKAALIFIAFAMIGCASASLSDDLQDIINVLPLDQISKIAERHSKTDPQFQEVEAYMKGAEWQTLLAQVEQQDAYKTLLKYLYQVGLDIQKIFDYIKHLIDQFTKLSLATNLIVEDSGSTESAQTDTESLRSFLDEVESIIPTQKLLAVVIDKMTHSEDFKNFYNELSRQDTYQIVERTRKLPQVQEMLQKLEGMDAKVDNAIAVVYAMLGWPIPQAN